MTVRKITLDVLLWGGAPQFFIRKFQKVSHIIIVLYFTLLKKVNM